MGQQMNVRQTRTAPVFPGNVLPMFQNIGQEEKKLSWLIRLTNWIGITMARTEDPRGWSFNPATVTLTLVIVSMVAGGAYYMGRRDNQADAIEQQLREIKGIATQADEKATYAVAGKDKEDGHGPNANTNSKSK